MNWHACSRKSDKKKKWAEFWEYCRGKFAFYILVNKLMMRTKKCSRKKNFFRFSWCAWRREEMWIKFGNVHKRSDDIVFFIRLAYWPKVKHVTRGQNKGKKKIDLCPIVDALFQVIDSEARVITSIFLSNSCVSAQGKLDSDRISLLFTAF